MSYKPQEILEVALDKYNNALKNPPEMLSDPDFPLDIVDAEESVRYIEKCFLELKKAYIYSESVGLQGVIRIEAEKAISNRENNIRQLAEAGW